MRLKFKVRRRAMKKPKQKVQFDKLDMQLYMGSHADLSLFKLCFAGNKYPRNSRVVVRIAKQKMSDLDPLLDFLRTQYLTVCLKEKGKTAQLVDVATLH